ncbi:MAG TPA: phosphatase PAP2 family protein [Anaerolineae bacterium]|nr:phosphatase PAP2 family protein [Anaerolineae bacterium]
MDIANWYEIGLVWTSWLQTNLGFLEGLFRFVTNLNSTEAFLALFPFLYWCVDKRFGLHLSYIFLVTVGVNATGKQLFRAPRPFWMEPDLALAKELSYGFPSGHTQVATTLYFFAALWWRKTWLWVAMVILFVLMAISRIYLGMHFPQDIIGGFLLGVLVLVGYFGGWQRWLEPMLVERSGKEKVAIGLGLMVVMLGLFFAAQVGGYRDDSGPWVSFYEAADLQVTEDMVSMVGVMMGLLVGWYFESRDLRFEVAGSWGKRLGRYVVGMVVTAVIWAGLGAIFPDEPLVLALPLRALRYGLVGVWVAFGGPWLFVKLGWDK